MKLKKIPVILTIMFFLSMIFLTFFARSIHNRMIPNVKVARLTKEEFVYERVSDDGTKRTATKLANAVPKKMYDEDFLYVVVQGLKNGDDRTFAKKVSILIGTQNDEYYEITEQFYDMNRLFIMESNKDISDGTEVYVLEN